MANMNLMDRIKTLLIFLAVGAFVNVGAQNDEESYEKSILGQSDWGQLWDELSLYAPVHTLFHDEIEDSSSDKAAPMFTEEEILLFKDVFKFLPTLKDSAFGAILERGSIPSDFVLPAGETLDDILQEVVQGEQFEQFLQDKLSSLLAGFAEQLPVNSEEDQEEEYKDAEDIASLDNEDLAEELPVGHLDGDHEQVDGWEGCRRDYNALALPWTNSILARLARTALERLIPEETFQCNATCEAICLNYPLHPRICTGICDNLCANFTYDELVDLVVNVLFPQIPKARWNRAMFDAMGKVPPALVDGQLHWSGGYDRCLEIEVNYTYNEGNISGPIIEEHRKFNGQYYRIPFKPPVFQDRRINLLFGACVPSTCDKDGVFRYITEENDLFWLLNGVLNWTVVEEKMFNGEHEKDISQEPGLIFLLIYLLVTLIVVTIPATIYDIYFREGVMKKHVDSINRARRAYRKTFLRQMSNDSSLANKTGGQIPNGDTPDSYYHVHSDDYRRFSVSSETSNNYNNNNGTRKTPELFHSMSTQSTTELIDNYPTTVVESEPITVWDKLEVWFVAFSVYSNLKRMFQIKNLETDLPALDCVRFLSFAWAVLGYTWVLGPIVSECWLSANVLIVLTDYLRSWGFQIIVNFHFSTDSFFLISGILVAYYWLNTLDGEQKTVLGWVKTCLLFYLKRYWRIAPAFMMNLVFYSMTYKYLSGGAFAPHEVVDAENCKVNWWSNLLMMHNIVSTDKLCLSWTWFLPALFQLLIMCPMILMPLVIKPLIGYIVLAAVYIIHIAITAGVVSGMTENNEVDIGAWIYDYFFTPWCRAGPFCIGIAYGIVLQKKPKKYKMPKWFVLIGFIVSLVLIGSSTYGLYGQFKVGGGLWDRSARVMYNTFARSGFALGLGFIVLICCTGNGGFLGEVMNWRVFQPLSRMAFISYFMSAPLIFSHAYGVLSPVWISTKTMMHWFLSNMIISYVAGIVLSGLCVHYPYTLGIERMFRVKTKEDCIKAGRHPAMVELIPTEGNIMAEHAASSANITEMNNPLQRSVSMNAGYDTLQEATKSSSEDAYAKLEKSHEGGSGFNRQDSTTSL